jgi:hypothetical protein
MKFIHAVLCWIGRPGALLLLAAFEAILGAVYIENTLLSLTAIVCAAYLLALSIFARGDRQ